VCGIKWSKMCVYEGKVYDFEPYLKDFNDYKPFPDDVDHFAKNHLKIGPVVFDSTYLIYTSIYIYKIT
jgi:hypothetical protein